MIEKQIANELMSKLRSGTIPKLGIDEIIAACEARPEWPTHRVAQERFLEQVTRKVVELC